MMAEMGDDAGRCHADMDNDAGKPLATLLSRVQGKGSRPALAHPHI